VAEPPPIRNALRGAPAAASNDSPIASAKKSATIAIATAIDVRAAELKAFELELIFLSFNPRLDAHLRRPRPQPPPISVVVTTTDAESAADTDPKWN